MEQYAVALDLGTSGFRAQSLDPSSGRVISTAISTCHPLPGSNIIDHIHFTIDAGIESAHIFVIQAVNRLLNELKIDQEKIIRMAICGNPVQLSIFLGNDVEDLAYAGSKKLESLGLSGIVRNAAVLKAENIKGLNLPAECEIIVPPCIHREVGADALAMIIKTGILERNETAIATDFGTNAEMALFHNGVIYTGSTAAGPAIEGGHISCGTLAVPGAISDVQREGEKFRLSVLNRDLIPQKGSLIELPTGVVSERVNGIFPKGITGTGVISLIDEMIQNNFVTIPKINTPEGKINLSEGITFTQEDFAEAGKAIGAIRTGHLTLCMNAGISLNDIKTACIAGAAGTYMNINSAQRIGLVPPEVKTVIQAGNTSLAMARDLAVEPEKVEEMNRLAEKLRNTYCMFSSSKAFNWIYLLEFSYWTEGMPADLFRSMLRKYGYPDFNPAVSSPEIIRTMEREIGETGGMPVTVTDFSSYTKLQIDDCTGCGICRNNCPTKAIRVDIGAGDEIEVNLSACNGVSCRICERVCPEKCFCLNNFFIRQAGQPICP